MNLKRYLKFYFGADSLNRALDDRIYAMAIRSADCVMGGEGAVDVILRLISVKDELSALWASLDGVMSGLEERDRRALERYAGLRCGIRTLGDGDRKELHRAAVKFTRRCVQLKDKLERGRGIVAAYCALC